MAHYLHEPYTCGQSTLPMVFYQTVSGNEPVREWSPALRREDHPGVFLGASDHSYSVAIRRELFVDGQEDKRFGRGLGY